MTYLETKISSLPQGFTLKITTAHAMPYVGLRKSDNDQIILDRGIFVEVFHELTRLLNFSYVTILPPDGEWGALKDDGTWSGMVGQLDSKTVDLGMLLVECMTNQQVYHDFYSCSCDCFNYN